MSDSSRTSTDRTSTSRTDRTDRRTRTSRLKTTTTIARILGEPDVCRLLVNGVAHRIPKHEVLALAEQLARVLESYQADEPAESREERLTDVRSNPRRNLGPHPGPD